MIKSKTVLAVLMLVALVALWMAETAVALTVTPLPGNPYYNYKVKLTYEDLTAAAGGSDTTVTIAVLPTVSTNQPGMEVRSAAMKLVTAFDASDSGINSLLLEVGDGGDTDRFLTQTETAVDGTEITYKTSAASTFPFAYTAGDTIDVKFTVAGGANPTIDELTSGEVEVYLQVVDLNVFSGN